MKNDTAKCMNIIGAKTRINEETGCHEWIGKVGSKGYASIRCNGKMLKVHRLVYEHVNDIDLGKNHVLHRCDNRRCCNPDHLFMGTNADNIEDKVEKDRSGKKLDKAKARRVFAMVKSGISQSEVAETFGISQPVVSRIASGQRWSHATLGRV